MKPMYEIDFSALSAEEKVKFMCDLRDSMKASFQETPFSIQLLAHSLIFTRDGYRIAVGLSGGKM